MEGKNLSIDMISLMVQETYDAVESGMYSSEFDNQTLNVCGSYDAERRCFILTINNTTFECPENWGPFKDISHYGHEFTIEIQIDRSHDNAHFLDIIADIKAESIENMTLYIENNEIQIFYNTEYSQKSAA